jgi:hypothetical protein
MRRTYLLPIALLSLAATSLFGQESLPLGDIARQARATRTAETSQDEAQKYLTDVRELLEKEKFDQIDRQAASERSSKARFSGGGWKLPTLYVALSGPASDSDATDIEWTTRIETLKRWISQRPDSITPRVALADAYLGYAWKARGSGYADKVTDEGMKLFDERAELAKTTLDDAAALKEKCPQWYNVMQIVALAQGWSKAQAARLFEHAIAFEPTFHYYYQAYAKYLLPKWYGEEGDSEQFADAISSRIGGKQGSIIYFEIAAGVGCHCSNETLLQHMSWTKMQQGYAALEELYGTSPLRLNQFAYMAVKMRDAGVAQPVFARIGENWDKETWRTEKYFDDCKAWIARMAAVSNQIRMASSAVETNLQTKEGRQYDGQIAKEFGDKFAAAMQQCVETAGNDLGSFDFLVQLRSEGAVQQVFASRPTPVSQCLFPKLLSSTFAPPPKPLYWVKIGMNIRP